MDGMPILDTGKLLKLKALMDDRSAPEGEREAARRKAERLADTACMSLEQAMREAERNPAARPPAQPQAQAGFKDIFEQVAREMREERERKHPGIHAREEAERQRKRQEVIDRYGSEDAVFEDDTHDNALERALTPFERSDREWVSYEGYTYGCPPPEMLVAMQDAKLLPVNVKSAWLEWRRIEARRKNRVSVCRGHDEPEFVTAYFCALENILDTMPAMSSGDLKARMEWTVFASSPDWDQRTAEECHQLAETTQADINRMIAKMKELQIGQQAAPHRTNADKADRVKSLLQMEPDLSDREIARRAGVSPQTVGNWRKRLADPAR